jgi:hypothetical protein
MPAHLATPARPARSSVGKALPGARNEARTIRWVTLALGLVTGAFLLSVYLLTDRHRPTLRAHADPAVVTTPADVTTGSTTTLPSTTPPAAPGSAAESAQAPPSLGKPPHPRRGLVLRFARRR